MLTSPGALTATELQLREQVRNFLAETLPWGTFEPGLGMGAEVNPQFSAALGERSWIGMAVPARYGGHDATAVDRFLVVEELLRWCAPVGHHWVADRQIAQVLLRYGTEEQKRAWRDEAGGHHRWAHRLGAALVACGPDALYPAIQSGSEVQS